jgi:tetratricopeptide (TPR) repeat protein
MAGLLTGVRYEEDTFPLRTVAFGLGAPRWKFVGGALATGVAFLALAGSWPFTKLIAGDLWAYQGDCRVTEGKLDEAIHLYRRAIRLTPYRVKYHERLGEILIKRANGSEGEERYRSFTEAVEAYRSSLALVPANARSAYGLGSVLRSLGNPAEADLWLARAVEHDPQNPLYWKHWGEVKLLRGDALQAARSFRRAAELAVPHNFFPKIFGPLNDADHFVERGESALLLQQPAVAWTSFAIAKELDPGHPGAQIGLAVSTLKRGERWKAEGLLAEVRDPSLIARWFAALAEVELNRGKMEEAQKAIEESLRLDGSNLLARQLQFLLAKARAEDAGQAKALEQVFSLNQSPVFIQRGEGGYPIAVWEPEKGEYKKGQRIYEGWALFGNGRVHQSFALPPGGVRFRIVARGDKAQGTGPVMKVSWSGKPIFVAEVTSENWAEYEIKTKVAPGESVLMIEFTNDLRDREMQEDRNLRLEKVTAIWEAF